MLVAAACAVVVDVADVVDASEDIRNNGVVNGKPAILLLVWRQPGANIIDTVDRVRAILPQLQAAIPPTVALVDAVDRTTTIRASVHDVQRTLGLSILLVILVVFVFFRTVRTAIIPSVVVPVSLIGTFGAMYLLGYSVNNLSLMALTIATGFVVDDAIVVIENIMRHLEQGTPPHLAALVSIGTTGDPGKSDADQLVLFRLRPPQPEDRRSGLEQDCLGTAALQPG